MVTELPTFLDDQLNRMGATWAQEGGHLQPLLNATKPQSLKYLGTYFPKTVIESWNIVSELLTIAPIGEAFSQEEKVIRILDVGSGTGGAVIGVLMGLHHWNQFTGRVEITSIDGNKSALILQDEMLRFLLGQLRFPVKHEYRSLTLPTCRQEFTRTFQAFANDHQAEFDLVLCWKCLCEFYWSGSQDACGIIQEMISIASSMLVPTGLCIVSDITRRIGGQHFSKTLNSECNAHDRTADAASSTIIPVPCAKYSARCQEPVCFTQRQFNFSHRLRPGDRTKIAYRVTALTPFARRVIQTFHPAGAYRVDAHDKTVVCVDGRICTGTASDPCGFTAFQH